MIKRLANLKEMQSSEYGACMDEINAIARRGNLTEYKTYSRLWEYPWAWLQLQKVFPVPKGVKVLDIGSEMSPMAWFLATKGFDVTLSDRTARYVALWRRASKALETGVTKVILNAQRLDWPTASTDVCTSFSVFEHLPDQKTALSEMARVIKPGGLLLLTFDICEPDQGMTFPAWNGRAPTIGEFDELLRENPWFETAPEGAAWNIEDMMPFLAWNRTTAPHHNYVTGGLLLRRNEKLFEETESTQRQRRWSYVWRSTTNRLLWCILPTHGTCAYNFGSRVRKAVYQMCRKTR